MHLDKLRVHRALPLARAIIGLALLIAASLWPSARAQVSASIAGLVSDPSGAAVPSANVTATETETGVSRTASSDGVGRYLIVALPVGLYEVKVSKPGFQESTRTGIHLNVGQEANIDVRLEVNAVKAAVTVSEDAPVVNTSTSDISGLVGAKEIKQLPLNGRSYDLLLPLNPGIVNFTSQKTGGTGISNSSTGNNFSVSGNRPQQNLFLLNGVEFTGAAENNMTPGGPSGMLLGVDGVREFNVQRDSYGAEFGKHPGGQVIIVTQSGSNTWHGSLYEFVRNNALDAANYFDQGSAPPFQRNQFGASSGGAVRKDKTFLFANYEGFRQDLNQTSVAFVPWVGCARRCRSQCAAVAKSLADSRRGHARAGCARPDVWHFPSFQQPAADDSRGFRHRAPGSNFFGGGFSRGDLHHRRRGGRYGDAGEPLQHGHPHSPRTSLER